MTFWKCSTESLRVKLKLSTLASFNILTNVWCSGNGVDLYSDVLGSSLGRTPAILSFCDLSQSFQVNSMKLTQLSRGNFFPNNQIMPILRLYCCMSICCRGNVFTETYPSSGRLFLLIKNLLPSSGCCFVSASRSLPTNASIRYSIFH
jgi:hypothetical protein